MSVFCILSVNPLDAQVIQIIRLILKNSAYFRQMLRLPRDANIFIHLHQQDFSTHLETYLTEIRTITRLNNIHLSHSSSSTSSPYSFRDYLTDDVELIFHLTDDQATRELVAKHEERLSIQVEKLKEDIATNATIIQAHQENQDAENIEREERRREVLLEEMKLTERRHETFVHLAQKRTVVEKKNKKEKRV